MQKLEQSVLRIKNELKIPEELSKEFIETVKREESINQMTVVDEISNVNDRVAKKLYGHRSKVSQEEAERVLLFGATGASSEGDNATPTEQKVSKPTTIASATEQQSSDSTAANATGTEGGNQREKQQASTAEPATGATTARQGVGAGEAAAASAGGGGRDAAADGAGATRQ